MSVNVDDDKDYAPHFGTRKSEYRMAGNVKNLSKKIIANVLEDILEKYSSTGQLTKAERVFVMEYHKTLRDRERVAEDGDPELEDLGSDAIAEELKALRDKREKSAKKASGDDSKKKRRKAEES